MTFKGLGTWIDGMEISCYPVGESRVMINEKELRETEKNPNLKRARIRQGPGQRFSLDRSETWR